MTSPIKFCGATVISFSASLGLGSQESSLSIEMVQDCEGDSFSADVGAPAYFTAGAFSFGGIITNLSKKLGSSGKTISAKMTDPRQILQNCVIIIDSYAGPPINAPNFFNVYASFEQGVRQGNCGAFGSAMSGERGMPYAKILEGLRRIGNTVYTPTGYQLNLDVGSLLQSGVGQLPEFYRVPGPSITIADLIQNICDLMGLEYYVNLNGTTISFGFIDLKREPGALNVGQYEGVATEISYGQELRNEISKTLVFGDKVHYMSIAGKSQFFFGEDTYNSTEPVPIVANPTGSINGFVINKKIDGLNLSLDKPLGSNGPFSIYEMDIRAAMASYKTWSDRAFDEDIPGGLNQAVRSNWPEGKTNRGAAARTAANAAGAHAARGTVDLLQQPNKGATKLALPDIDRDLNKVWSFVKSLGETYYGKQYIVALNQKICYYTTNEFGEKVYSDTPTNEGGWVEPYDSVLGLGEPELSFFRQDDNRVGCFALFAAGDSTFGEFAQ